MHMAKMKFCLKKTYVIDGYSFGPCEEIDVEPRFGNKLVALGIEPIGMVLPAPAEQPEPESDAGYQPIVQEPESEGGEESAETAVEPSLHMTKADLQAMAKERGVDVEGLTKSQIVDALK